MAWPTDFLLGTPQQTQQLPVYSGQTQNVLNELVGMGKSQLQANPTSFAPIAQEARTGFQQYTVPQLSERLEALGGSNRGSSALPGVLSRAGAGLERSLGALGSDYNLRQQSLAQNLIRLGLTPSFENVITPAQPGLIHGAAPALGQAAGSALASLAGGVGDVVGGVLSKVGAPLASGIATSLGAATPYFWPILGAAAAGTGLYYGGKYLYDNWGKLKDYYQRKGNKLRELYGKKPYYDVTPEAPPQIAQLVQDNPEQLRQFFSNPNVPDMPPQALAQLIQQQQPQQGNQQQQPPTPAQTPTASTQSPTVVTPATVASVPPAVIQNANRQQRPKIVCKNGKCRRV